MDLQQRFDALVGPLVREFDIQPELQDVLFVIGLREVGKRFMSLSKSQKMDLIHVGTCASLEKLGYYELIGNDDEGWPHYKLIQQLPRMGISEQEDLIREAVCIYLEGD